ncbi:MAG TPA: VanZ family protein [Burkholderiales bacterium]|nr:VanZ family protein [Burkholderiales bacterium]
MLSKAALLHNEALRLDSRMAAAAPSPLALYLTLAYACLIVYTSLTPFAGWRDPGLAPWSFLLAPRPRYITRFDLLVNFLAYLPFGFFCTLALIPRLTGVAAALLAALLGIALSFGMEALQLYLPGRVSTKIDLLCNGLGAVAGALAGARFGRTSLAANYLRAVRNKWFLRTRVADFGLVLLALWVFTQLNPSLPLLGNVFSLEEIRRQSMSPGLPRNLNLLDTAMVLLNFISVVLLATLVARSRRRAVIAAAALIAAGALIKLLAAAFMLKPFALMQWLGPEVAVGMTLGAPVALLLAMLRPRIRVYCCAGALLLGLALTHLAPLDADPMPGFQLFEWHYGHLLNYKGLAKIAADLWPYLALVFLWLRQRDLLRDETPESPVSRNHRI